MQTKTFNWPDLGHDLQAKYIQRGITDKTLAHAFILYGPSGIGKEVFAKNSANSIVCSDDLNRPCGHCQNCISAKAGLHPDVHSIAPSEDGSISVDQIRDLKRTLYFHPVLSSQKVAILSQAHTMTMTAANALLKILEEPPKGVTIFLIADTLQHIPTTVLSRCQVMRFTPASRDTLERSLDSLSDDAELKAMIAHYAQGRVMMAKDILNDSATRYTERTGEIIGLLESSLLERMLQAPQLAHYVQDDSETDIDQRTEKDFASLDVLETLLRDVMLLQAGVTRIANTGFESRLRRIADRMPLSQARGLLHGLSELRLKLRTYAQAQLAWEYFFINS